MAEAGSVRIIGRYALHDKIASGGMATIHLGCTLGAVGFARAVVVKRLHKEYAANREFVEMFVDEARLASRVRHPNVIPTLDVLSEGGEIFLVMDYVHGESLARLIAKAAQSAGEIPLSIVCAVGVGMLEGLHAAHEATSERGEALHLVHRDVSPQNVIVGVDGITRVFDFGIAKAAVSIHETNHGGSGDGGDGGGGGGGGLKGKMAYMAPEQISNDPIDRRADVWAAAVVLWEMTTRRRLFVGKQAADYLDKILHDPIPPASEYATCSEAFDRVLQKALERDPKRRFASAREFSSALEEIVEPATMRVVGEWVSALAEQTLEQRAMLLKAVERSTTTDPESIRRQVSELALPTSSSEAQLLTERMSTLAGVAHRAGEPVAPHRTNIEAVDQMGTVVMPAHPPMSDLSIRTVTAVGQSVPPPPAPLSSGRGRRLWKLVVPALLLVVAVVVVVAFVWKKRPAPVSTAAATTTTTTTDVPPSTESSASQPGASTTSVAGSVAVSQPTISSVRRPTAAGASIRSRPTPTPSNRIDWDSRK